MNKRKFLKRAGAASVAAGLVLASRSIQAQAAAGETKVLIVYHSVTGNTEKMARGVAEGATGVSGAGVVLKKVGEVTGDDLLACDALIVGSPVYFANMAGEIKTFFDSWGFKLRLFTGFKMRNKIGGAFVTGASVSNGKETTMQSIHAAMLINQMSIVSGGGAFGASATTGPDSPGIDEKEFEAARALGKHVAELAAVTKRGSKS